MCRNRGCGCLILDEMLDDVAHQLGDIINAAIHANRVEMRLFVPIIGVIILILPADLIKVKGV